jgi:hypothetical protein
VHQSGSLLVAFKRDRGGEIKVVGRSSSMSFLYEIIPVEGYVRSMLNVNVIKDFLG